MIHVAKCLVAAITLNCLAVPPDVEVAPGASVSMPSDGTPGVWDFALTDASGRRHEEKGLLFVGADCETVSYLDDYAYENIEFGL